MTVIFVRLIAWPCSTESSNNGRVSLRAAQRFDQWQFQPCSCGACQDRPPKCADAARDFWGQITPLPGPGPWSRLDGYWLRDDARCLIGQITPQDQRFVVVSCHRGISAYASGSCGRSWSFVSEEIWINTCAASRADHTRSVRPSVGSVDSWATACKPQATFFPVRQPSSWNRSWNLPFGGSLGQGILGSQVGGTYPIAWLLSCPESVRKHDHWVIPSIPSGCNWFSPVIHSATFSGELLARLQGDLWLGHKPYGSYGAAVAAPCAAGHRDLKPHNFLFLREARCWWSLELPSLHDDSHHAIHDSIILNADKCTPRMSRLFQKGIQGLLQTISILDLTHCSSKTRPEAIRGQLRPMCRASQMWILHAGKIAGNW